MTTLNITARQFKALVSPVLPCAGTEVGMPTLNSIRIEVRGGWLVAMATDRFRLAVHRMVCPSDCDTDWAGTVPLSAVKGIISTFAPKRGMDADLRLVIDGGNLLASAAGALVGGFFDASFKWPLESGEFPKVDKLLAKSIADAESQPTTKVRADFLADFRAADTERQGLFVKITGSNDRSPMLVTDGEDFIAIVMPRRGGLEFPALTDWSAILNGTPETAVEVDEGLPEAASA